MTEDRDVVLNYLAAFERLFPLDPLPKIKRVGDKFASSWNGHRYPAKTKREIIEQTERLNMLAARDKQGVSA